VVQRRHGALVRVRAGQIQNVLTDQRQGVGQDGDLVAVLLDILGKGIAHQTPAGNVAHPPQKGVKLIGHRLPFA